ncbi:MAG: flagellar biosynthesis anti-sigma factor FlgM [Alphaproteobacteria bacterium]|nr:flagellar biosynthesis anti-sigma factor FlgM [Alphaproteobacteria bacterium]
MADPINGISGGGTASVGSLGGAQSTTATVPAAAEPTAAPVDTANVSKTAGLLETIKAVGDSLPVVDEARVASVKSALEAGTLPQQPQQIAQKLIEIDAVFGRSGQ